MVSTSKVHTTTPNVPITSKVATTSIVPQKKMKMSTVASQKNVATTLKITSTSTVSQKNITTQNNVKTTMSKAAATSTVTK